MFETAFDSCDSYPNTGGIPSPKKREETGLNIQSKKKVNEK